MINKLRVKRETEISYILTDGYDEVFLHKREAKKPYHDNEEIEVFIYLDNQGRTTASTRKPIIVRDEIALLKVVSINTDYGVFLYNGLAKDLLLSKDDLPGGKDKWPQVDDHIFVGLEIKNDNLFAYIPTRKEMHEYFSGEPPVSEGEVVTCYCERLIPEGIVCNMETGQEIFVHKNNYRTVKRIGEKLEVKILKHLEPGKYSGTLIEQKELMLEKDAEKIYKYLEKHGGKMPYTDKTDKDIISDVFHMSKAAFKRGLGNLYKAKKVILTENETKIIK